MYHNILKVFCAGACMDFNYFYILFWIASYIIGSISSGDIIVNSFTNKNIRTLGTLNPGASNIYSEISPKFGVIVFFVDIFKGALSTLPLVLLGYASWIPAISMGALLLGHMVKTPWGKYGGTGMATAMGAGVGLLPLGALIGVFPSFLILLITKRPSFTGAAAFLLSIIGGWLIYQDLISTISILIAASAVLIKYQSQYKLIKID
ncbi:MAG: hypothetical protein CL795_02320 [Chloroflexi bacterium]|nr:hypothetical protein [Chloroflexota bacterium]